MSVRDEVKIPLGELRGDIQTIIKANTGRVRGIVNGILFPNEEVDPENLSVRADVSLKNGFLIVMSELSANQVRAMLC